MPSMCTLWLTVILATFTASYPLDNSVTSADKSTSLSDALLDFLKTEPRPDGKPHDLTVGSCKADETLLHSEAIVVNNDGKSRVTGSIRMNVEAPVNITCVKLYDEAGSASGAFPSVVDGGVGHNFVVFGIDTAYGYSIKFFVQLYGA